MFEPSEMYASQTTCACYKWTSSRTLFSHSGVNSTEHGMFDHKKSNVPVSGLPALREVSLQRARVHSISECFQQIGVVVDCFL